MKLLNRLFPKKKKRKPRTHKARAVYIDEDYIQAMEELRDDPLYEIKKKLLKDKPNWWKRS